MLIFTFFLLLFLSLSRFSPPTILAAWTALVLEEPLPLPSHHMPRGRSLHGQWVSVVQRLPRRLLKGLGDPSPYPRPPPPWKEAKGQPRTNRVTRQDSHEGSPGRAAHGGQTLVWPRGARLGTGRDPYPCQAGPGPALYIHWFLRFVFFFFLPFSFFFS